MHSIYTRKRKRNEFKMVFKEAYIKAMNARLIKNKLITGERPWRIVEMVLPISLSRFRMR